MERYSKIQAEYVGLQNRRYRPPFILVSQPAYCDSFPDAISNVRFIPSLHRVSHADCKKMLKDLLSHPEAKMVAERLIRQYAENPGKIIDVCGATMLPMMDLESYIFVLIQGGMIYPGITLEESYDKRREALCHPTL